MPNVDEKVNQKTERLLVRAMPEIYLPSYSYVMLRIHRFVENMPL